MTQMYQVVFSMAICQMEDLDWVAKIAKKLLKIKANQMNLVFVHTVKSNYFIVVGGHGDMKTKQDKNSIPHADCFILSVLSEVPKKHLKKAAKMLKLPERLEHRGSKKIFKYLMTR